MIEDISKFQDGQRLFAEYDTRKEDKGIKTYKGLIATLGKLIGFAEEVKIGEKTIVVNKNSARNFFERNSSNIDDMLKVPEKVAQKILNFYKNNVKKQTEKAVAAMQFNDRINTTDKVNINEKYKTIVGTKAQFEKLFSAIEKAGLTLPEEAKNIDSKTQQDQVFSLGGEPLIVVDRNAFINSLKERIGAADNLDTINTEHAHPEFASIIQTLKDEVKQEQERKKASTNKLQDQPSTIILEASEQNIPSTSEGFQQTPIFSNQEHHQEQSQPVQDSRVEVKQEQIPSPSSQPSILHKRHITEKRADLQGKRQNRVSRNYINPKLLEKASAGTLSDKKITRVISEEKEQIHPINEKKLSTTQERQARIERKTTSETLTKTEKTSKIGSEDDWASQPLPDKKLAHAIVKELIDKEVPQPFGEVNYTYNKKTHTATKELCAQAFVRIMLDYNSDVEFDKQPAAVRELHKVYKELNKKQKDMIKQCYKNFDFSNTPGFKNVEERPGEGLTNFLDATFEAQQTRRKK